MDAMGEFLGHPLTMLIIGILTNWLAVLMDESGKAGKPVNALAHLKKHPYRTALSVVASLGSFGALSSTTTVDPVTALVLGYAGTDVLTRLVATTSNKMMSGAGS